MVKIPAGTFFMGRPESEAEWYNDETQHKVTISRDFWIGEYEVTQAEWEAIMGNNPSKFKGKNLPVEQVSWYDVVEYCNKLSKKKGLTPAYTIDKERKDSNNKGSYDSLRWTVTWNRNANGYRLPTEAEWEYACRAGTTTAYNTGDNITTNQANYDGNAEGIYRGQTTPVGSFSPNNWGLYDMHGNVDEWCWDRYSDYTNKPQVDPIGIDSGEFRVFRGGNWYSSRLNLRSAWRISRPPNYAYYGFRVVRNN